MSPADLARHNAIPLEIKKDGLQQRQNGDWVLRFVVQACDMDERITKAAMGTRFQAALVIIGDDELPVQSEEKDQPQASKTMPATPQPKDKPAGAKRDWRDLSPQQQAGIHCADPIFAAFLKEQRPDDWHEAQDAAECVRLICGVESRKMLETNQRARIIWKQLDDQFFAWKAFEHA